MKDLNHYFISPKNSDNEDINGISSVDININQTVSNKRKLKKFSTSLESLPNGTSKKKKKKKNSLKEFKECDLENNLPKIKRKRKKLEVEESVKKPRLSKLLETVKIPENIMIENEKINNGNHIKITSDISSDSGANTSFENEEKFLKSSNSLHNYFNKVDKLPDAPLKTNLLKVEAVVHYPPSKEKLKPPKGLKTKLRRRKSEDLRIEYDIITSEEDNSILNHSTSELYVNNTILTENSRISEDTIILTPEPLKEVELNNSSYLNNHNDTTRFKKDDFGTFTPNRIKHDGTLISFFKKNSTKMIDSPVPNLNKEQIQARKEFLNSGLPNIMKKGWICKKEELEYLVPAQFPKFRHINQPDVLNGMWNLQTVQLKFNKQKSKIITLPKWSAVTCCRQMCPEYTDLKTELPLTYKQQKKIFKKILKKEVSNYPLANWYEDLIKLKKTNANEMWNEKYRPHSSSHLIGNSKNTEKLKLWLEKLNNSGKKARTTYCSEDEFVKSDDEYLNILKNTAFLKGPSGSGKTSSIYALAEEVGYKILEINSSFNRMGKKILHEFSEALQSHKVETNVLNFPGLKKNKKDECKKSLILIEDVDITFSGYDDGFISTIATLASASKRPVIFTVNEFHPKYLTKLVPLMHFKLDYNCISPKKLCSWIRIIALIEGVLLDKQDLFTLVNWANSDVRKILLQLQFSVVNGSELISKNHRLCTNTVWGKLSDCKITNDEEIKRVAGLTNLLAVCDMFSLEISNQLINDEPCRTPWQTRIKDSSELNQPNEFLDFKTAEILADTINILNANISTAYPKLHSTFNRIEKPSMIPIVERDILSPSAVLSHSTISADYLPSLRAIARSENERLANQSRRNHRYFNYLQSVGLNEDTINLTNWLSNTLNSQ